MSVESDRIRRFNNKWAMCGYKGGRCVSCSKIVTCDNIADFEFDHKDGVTVNNGEDKSDRWGGAIRHWQPFTEKWYEWANRVDLICGPCHRKRHSRDLPLLDWDAQARIDNHQVGPELIQQLGML